VRVVGTITHPRRAVNGLGQGPRPRGHNLVQGAAKVKQPFPLQRRREVSVSAESRLFLAIRTQDLEGARQALADGASPDARDTFGQTALCTACLVRAPELALLLVEAGADVALRGTLTPPLSAAASQGLVPVVVALLAKGAPLVEDARILASINGHHEVVALLEAAQGRRAEAPPPDPVPELIEAAAAGELEAVLAALAAGVPVDTLREGNTALHWAAVRGHAEVVIALLEAGADVSRADGSGRTALAFASRTGSLEIVRLLLLRGAVADGPALLQAAQNGREDIVSVLLEAGASPDVIDGTGKTPLILAARSGHAGVVRRLLEAGARLDLVEREVGADALLAASLGTSVQVLEMLLDAGMAPDVRSEDAFTALSFAAGAGDLEMVRLLLARGASVDLANASGETPLLRAAAQGHTEMVKVLLGAGAAVDHAQRDGLTSLMAAAHGGHLGVVRVLLAAGADRELSSLALRKAHDYARLSGAEEVETLLAPPPVPVSRVTPRPVTPEEATEATRRLIAAVWHHDVAGATRALEDGAHIEGEGQEIPLVCAAHAGATDVVRLLIVNGAQLDRTDTTGFGALAKACGGVHVRMARALLEAGAKITPEVHMAASIRNDPRIRALLGS
jgi:ankyrin repeat protein